MMVPIWSATLIVFGLLLVSIESLPVKNQVEVQNEDHNEPEKPAKIAKKSGAEVQNILSMLESAMNEAPNGSRPKQVRFSVVGKRNFDDLNDILKQIEYQLDEKNGSNGNSGVVPVRFSLNGKR